MCIAKRSARCQLRPHVLIPSEMPADGVLYVFGISIEPNAGRARQQEIDGVILDPVATSKLNKYFVGSAHTSEDF